MKFSKTSPTEALGSLSTGENELAIDTRAPWGIFLSNETGKFPGFLRDSDKAAARMKMGQVSE